ncbi:hypothetical protein GN956_G8344 [Arapaima gigas]
MWRKEPRPGSAVIDDRSREVGSLPRAEPGSALIFPPYRSLHPPNTAVSHLTGEPKSRAGVRRSYGVNVQ